MEFSDEQQAFYNSCLEELKSRHGEATYYLGELDMYVKTTIKTRQVLEQVMEEEATLKHTNKARFTNEASNPKLRMFALLNEQAMKLRKALGLTLSSAKAEKWPKKRKGFNTGP